MQHSKDLDFEKVMNFIHPSLFKLATNGQLINAMKNAYDSEEMSIKFDWLLPLSANLYGLIIPITGGLIIMRK